MNYNVNRHYSSESNEVFEIIKDLKKLVDGSFYLMKVGLYLMDSNMHGCKLIVFTYLDDTTYVFGNRYTRIYKSFSITAHTLNENKCVFLVYLKDLITDTFFDLLYRDIDFLFDLIKNRYQEELNRL